MTWTIKTAEGSVVMIEEDFAAAEELTVFLDVCADAEGADPYTITETTDADIAELAAQETV